MNSRLFVGNLSYNTGEDALREAFEPFGAIRSATVVTDRETGRPRGFAFVEYESEDGAQRAIEGLNGSMLDGRSLNVDLAKERAPRGDGGGRTGGGGRRGGRGGDRF